MNGVWWSFAILIKSQNLQWITKRKKSTQLKCPVIQILKEVASCVTLTYEAGEDEISWLFLTLRLSMGEAPKTLDPAPPMMSTEILLQKKGTGNRSYDSCPCGYYCNHGCKKRSLVVMNLNLQLPSALKEIHSEFQLIVQLLRFGSFSPLSLGRFQWKNICTRAAQLQTADTVWHLQQTNLVKKTDRCYNNNFLPIISTL